MDERSSWLDQPRRHVVVFDGLPVGSDVAAGAVKVRFAHVERIEAEIPGDHVDHALDRQHSLRAAEAAEGGIRHGIGLDPPRMDSEFRKEIRIVGMEHGAIDDADADIRGASAAGVEVEIDGANAAVGFVADGVFDGEIVPLSGHRHVGVAIETQLARPPGHARRQRRDHRPLRRLRFLAAEAAAHAPHAAGHERVRHAEDAGNDVLHFARMLRRRIDQHRAVLTRHGKPDLALQIEVLLATDANRPRALPRRGGDRLGGVAVDEPVVRQHDLAGRPALLHRYVRLLGVDLDLAAKYRAARGIARRSDDGEDRLVVEIDAVLREDRLVGVGGRNVVLSRYVGCRYDRDDAGRVAHVGEIDMAQRAARHRRASDGEMQRPDRLGNVVDILGVALHVLRTAVVRQRLVYVAQRRLQNGITRRHRRRSGGPRCG